MFGHPHLQLFVPSALGTGAPNRGTCPQACFLRFLSCVVLFCLVFLSCFVLLGKGFRIPEGPQKEPSNGFRIRQRTHRL